MIRSFVNEKEGRFLNFGELADLVMASLDDTYRHFYPDQKKGTLSKLVRTWRADVSTQPDFTIEAAILVRQEKLKSVSEIQPDDEIDMDHHLWPLYWATQCDFAKELYSGGHTEQAWAMMLEVSQVAAALYIATTATVAMKKDGYMKRDEFQSLLAQRAASARHFETRSMKEDVFTWLDANMVNFKSMDAAAQAITKQQPIAFRTARDWVGGWKKLRAAGKP